MQNGNNTLHGGGYTVVIVPFQNNENKYYVFYSWGTACTEAYNGNPGVCGATNFGYSIVNMQNGVGIVESLNTNLIQFPYFIEGNGQPFPHAQRDHLTTTKHSDGNSYWVIYNPIHYFFVYKIDDSGVSLQNLNEDPWGSYFWGEYLESAATGGKKMTISPNGEKIAFPDDYSTPGSDGGGVSLNLYNFDNTSGIVTTHYLTNFYGTSNSFIKGSSVEFSPNSEYLYMIGNCSNCGGTGNSVVQFDVNNMSGDGEIIFSQQVYSEDYWMFDTVISLAKDGKIYIPGPNNMSDLSVINNPNSFGTNANFVEDQVDLFSGETLLLPQLVPIHEPLCPNDLDITQDVYSGETDIQEASNTITATNTIFSGGTAEYDAGDSILLDIGFKAEAGMISKTEFSHFYAYIDGCEVKEEKGKNISEQITKINSSFNEPTLIVFPNPSDGFFTINYPLGNNTSYPIEIYDINNLKKAETSITKDNKQIDLSHLKDGLYILKLFTNEKVLTCHFIISK